MSKKNEAAADEITQKDEQPKLPETVKIKMPLTRNEKDDVFVGINGKAWLIKRGVEVEVPLGVALVLQNRENMLSEAMEFEAQAAAPLDELKEMYG